MATNNQRRKQASKLTNEEPVFVGYKFGRSLLICQAIIVSVKNNNEKDKINMASLIF